MSKLDWDKVAETCPDPARAVRERRDIDLVNTPTARKEAKKKADARSKAAKAGALTRKLNHEKQLEADRRASLHKRVSVAAEETFWAQ